MSEVTRRELFPGVWLRTVHTNKFKSSFLSVSLLAPLRRETAGVNALIPSVLRRGTADHPDMESLSAALDNLYGGAIEPVIRKKGETQCVGFVASFLDDAYALEGEGILEPAAALMGELLLRPRTVDGVFDTDYVAGEKANLAARIRSQINDKRSYATHRLVELMCDEEHFGADKLGDLDKVEAITAESLWQRYEQLLKDSAVELYYSGSADPDRVAQALKSAFAALPVNENRIAPECDVRLTVGEEPRMFTDEMDVTQGKLALGFRTGGQTCWEEDYPALVICNAIFGGTAMSKLFMNVREKMSLCYYASSMVEKMKGVILVSSGIEFENYEKAKSEILHQLELVRQGQIDEGELEGARRILVGSYRSALDDQGRQEEFWLGQAAAGLDTTLEETAASFETVTKEQVARAAQKLALDSIYFLKGKEA